MARRLWTVFEPYHALIYFAPEAQDAFRDAGLKGYWMGYFASRAAPLGPVSAPVVTAIFYNFAPRMVERAIPDAWSFSSPDQVLRARLDAADRALRRLLGDAVDSPGLEEAAELARTAIAECEVGGRPLYAAYRSLPWPEAPHLRLWHATTLLREHRGDGHMASLLLSGVDGCEALVSFAGSEIATREMLQPIRRWTDEEWDAAVLRLIDRGWLDANGLLTDVGRAGRNEIERHTDELAMPPVERLGPTRTQRLYDLLRPLALRIIERGGIPMPNPMGVPAPQ